MTSISPSRMSITRWRSITFGVFAALLAIAFTFITGSFRQLLAPWTLLGATPRLHWTPELHRWQEAVGAALFVLLLSSYLVALLWRGARRPLVAQAFLLNFTLLLLFQLPWVGWQALILLAGVVGLFVLTYPASRALLRFTSPFWSRPLLVLALLTALALIPDIWRNISLQLTDTVSESGQDVAWAIAASVEVVLVVNAVLAASRRPGWPIVGGGVGATLLYLGAAALTVPTSTGSWGTLGGALGAIGGVAYLCMVVAMLRSRATAPAPDVVAPTAPARS